MTFSYNEFLQLLGLYFYPFVRFTAMFSIMPIFSSRALTAQSKIILALFITLIVAPGLPLPDPVSPFTWQGILLILQQVLIGLAIGAIFLVVFEAFVFAGHIIALSMGLAFATMVDPASGVQSPVVSQFYMIVVTLLFLSLNGHLLVIQVLTHTFDYLPVGLHGLSTESLKSIVEFGSFIFSAGILVAIPAVTALLLVNVSFGVIARAAPALNIFAVGFPVTLLVGLVMLSLTIPTIIPHLQELIHRAVETASQLHF